MKFIKNYKYLLLSFIFLISAFVLFYLYMTNEMLNIELTVLILTIIGVFFAFWSKKVKESIWVTTYMEVIGITALIFLIVWDIFSIIAWNFCGNGPC